VITVNVDGIEPFSELAWMSNAFFAEKEPDHAILHAQVSVTKQMVTGIICLVEGARYDGDIRSLPRIPGDHDGNKAVRSLGKRALLLALHQLLHRRTGRTLPWGVLFGVRPSKLGHGEPARVLVSEYAIRQDRAQLLVEVAENELRALPDLYQLGQEVSIYVGIPFCPTHCTYCTFPAYSMAEKARYAGDYMQALAMEIRAVGEALQAQRIPVTTVYIGGGTPTSLRAAELDYLLTLLQDHLPNADRWRELSVEAGRADTITADRVQVMKAAGVNRVSVNPQSFRDHTLWKVGRGHSAKIIDERFMLFREAGFENINMDLIMGLPGENLEDARFSLMRTLALAPDSVTIHTLSYKRGAQVIKGSEHDEVPAADMVEAMLDLAEQELRQHGLQPYYLYRQKNILAGRENIGYAHVGKEGLYNISIIEEAQTIVALGGGGASKWRDPQSGHIAHTVNARDPAAYVAHIEQIIESKRQHIDALAKKRGLNYTECIQENRLGKVVVGDTRGESTVRP
jgi:oxygen-independent coproporphyrinogen-3 oxidase